MKLSDKALLVQLNVSQWTARKLDKKATNDVALANNTGVHAGNYNKSLLPMNEYLDNVKRLTTFIRKEYYDNTLPWGIDGTMILPTDNYLDFMAKFKRHKSDWYQLVDKFLLAYPQLQLNAQRDLGSLYNPNEYPTEYELKLKFGMDMTVLPIPSDDFRVDIASSELENIRKQVGEKVESSIENAMREAWQRLYDKVQHIADKLSDNKNIFRDTMIDNLKELCDVLKRMNITNDVNLENIRQQVDTKLANNNPESLRLDLDLRRQKAIESREILKQMEEYMND